MKNARDDYVILRHVQPPLGIYLFVVLSQHVRKTGNPIRSLDLKLSCDKKVVPHGTRMRGRADRIQTTQIGTKSHDCQVELHNSRSHADDTRPQGSLVPRPPTWERVW